MHTDLAEIVQLILTLTLTFKTHCKAFANLIVSSMPGNNNRYFEKKDYLYIPFNFLPFRYLARKRICSHLRTKESMPNVQTGDPPAWKGLETCKKQARKQNI